MIKVARLDPPALAFLAQSIERAHDAGPNSWVITQTRTFVRLNVGQVAIVTLRAGSADVYVKAPVAPAGFGKLVYPRRGSIYSNRAVPARIQRLRLSLADISHVPPNIRVAHFAAIDAAARAKPSSPWSRHLATDLMRRVETVLGRTLPRPGEPGTAEYRAWVVKGRPDRNDFAAMMRPGGTGMWRTSKPPRQWAVGDRLFFWSSSPDKCVVGLGELAELSAGRSRGGDTAFEVRYLSGRLSHPVTQQQARNATALRSAAFLKAGPSGTLYKLSSIQASALLGLVRANNPDVSADWNEAGQVTGDREFPDDDDAEGGEEGRRLLRTHYQRERDPRLVGRKKASYRRIHGHLRCEICQFDFGASYGEIGADFCEVHHNVPLSGPGARQRRTMLADLAVVCSNCHRIIHRHHPLASVRQMVALRARTARRHVAAAS